jgi:hypothetical protein
MPAVRAHPLDRVPPRKRIVEADLGTPRHAYRPTHSRRLSRFGVVGRCSTRSISEGKGSKRRGVKWPFCGQMFLRWHRRGKGLPPPAKKPLESHP